MKSTDLKTGSELEAEVKRLADKLHAQGAMRLRKVDPPTFTTRKGLIHKTNPFLDFIGCDMTGRMINIECKCIHSSRLPILAKGKKGAGISFNQKEAIVDWANAGAVSGCLWYNGMRYYWVTAAVILQHYTQGAKSIPDSECHQLSYLPNGDVCLTNILSI